MIFWCGSCGWLVEYLDGQWSHCEDAFFGHQALPRADHDHQPPGAKRPASTDFKPLPAVDMAAFWRDFAWSYL